MMIISCQLSLPVTGNLPPSPTRICPPEFILCSKTADDGRDCNVSATFNICHLSTVFNLFKLY